MAPTDSTDAHRAGALGTPCAQAATAQAGQQRGSTRTNVSDPGQPSSSEAAAGRTQIEHVVALLEVVYRANGLLADELDRLASSRASVSDASVTGLLRLTEDLRPGAAARAQLAAFDPEVQVAGAAEWIARRRRVDPDGELLPTPRLAAGDERAEHAPVAHRPAASAVSRARTRWQGQAGPR